MYNSSTDAYQPAAKIMSHDYANKYANYWSKKNKVIKTGKANFKMLVARRPTIQNSLQSQSTKTSIQTARSSNV